MIRFYITKSEYVVCNVRKRKEEQERLKSRLLHCACEIAGIEGAESEIAYGKRGKPYLKNVPGYYFNISHSGPFVCLAFSDGEIGVDIEKIRPLHPRLPRRIFTREEQAWLAKQKESDQARAAIRLWTRKESYGKYLAEGLTKRVFETNLAPCQETEISARFFEYETDGYLVSICGESGEKCREGYAEIENISIFTGQVTEISVE